MSAQLTLGVDPLADVLAWKEKNPEAWELVVKWAHADRAHSIPPSTRLYCCLLRRPHFAALLGLERPLGSPVLVNDHVSSGLARLLNRLYPELDCPTREARADSWGGTP